MVLKPWFLKTYPWTLVLEPWSLIIDPWSLILDPSTFNLQPSTFNLQPSTMNIEPWTFYLYPWNFYLVYLDPWTWNDQVERFSREVEEECGLKAGIRVTWSNISNLNNPLSSSFQSNIIQTNFKSKNIFFLSIQRRFFY